MFKRLLSRLWGRGRTASARGRRGRSWPRENLPSGPQGARHRRAGTPSVATTAEPADPGTTGSWPGPGASGRPGPPGPPGFGDPASPPPAAEPAAPGPPRSYGATHAGSPSGVPGPRPPDVTRGGPGGSGTARTEGSRRAGSARARVRRKQTGAVVPPVRAQSGRDATASQTTARRPGQRTRVPWQPDGPGQGQAQGRGQERDGAAAKPWYELAGWQRADDGSPHCGSLESLVHRQWDNVAGAPPAAAHAIERLAALPQRIKDLLATVVDAIYVGPGGVPELDEMGRLRGVPLPSGRATWDACAGAYGDRKIVVGTRPSPSPDVMCHEVGHAVDDADAPPGRWQSDSPEFRILYDQCLPHLVSDFHRQQGALGRREFFADAFAAIASSQRPALVDMLGGSTRVALNVMLYFNRRYSI